MKIVYEDGVEPPPRPFFLKRWWRDARCKILHWGRVPGFVQPGDYGQIEIQVTEWSTTIKVKDSGIRYFFYRENGVCDGFDIDKDDIDLGMMTGLNGMSPINRTGCPRRQARIE